MFWPQPAGGFNPTAADWARIEAAYGYTLSEADRSVIACHVACYLRNEPQERFAAFADDAAKWLDSVHDAADILLRKLIWRDGPGTTSASDWERGCAYGRMLLGINLTQEPFSEWAPDKVDRLHGIVSQVIKACITARKDLAVHAEGGEREGWFWDHLIRELTAFAKQRNFPTGVAKGADKQKTVHASPFVGFVREIQGILPEQARRHMSSDAALAQAISVARRRPKSKMHAGHPAKTRG
jgi:hypothetical protein